MQDFAVKLVDWSDYSDALEMVRGKVFIAEQNVPVELERDAMDWQYTHALAVDNNAQAIATARLANAKIGRMAVLKPWRGKGVGRALLLALVDAARNQGLTEVRLDSQTQAQGFYRSSGFIAYGNEFVEAGIPHIKMKKAL